MKIKSWFSQIQESIRPDFQDSSQIKIEAVVEYIKRCSTYNKFHFFFDGQVIVCSKEKLCIRYENDSMNTRISVDTVNGRQVFYKQVDITAISDVLSDIRSELYVKQKNDLYDINTP